MYLLTINDDSSFFIAPICFPLDELGDIVLFPHQEQLIEESLKGNTKRAVLDKNMVTPWSNGIVPYVKDPQILGECSSKHSGHVVTIVLPTIAIVQSAGHTILTFSLYQQVQNMRGLLTRPWIYGRNTRASSL